MEKKNLFEQPSLESETIESLSAKLLETTAKLAATNIELRRIQKEREEMLSNISHDLRAPVTAIRSALDYLLSGQELSSADYQESLQLINRRTNTLEHLIQDMYYLFCVEDTSRALELETIDAAPFLETYFYDLLADSRYDNHEMILDMPETLDCTLNIDVQKIIRVLDNLFTNAAKYTPEGSYITLKAELVAHTSPAPDASFPKSNTGAEPSDIEPSCLAISVIDTGAGIPAEALPNLFKRTYTVSSSRTPGSTAGSGLGLSIVKAIVERHGGEVSCESKVGEGSKFIVTIPCKKSTQCI